jgi:hypothetical protein
MKKLLGSTLALAMLVPAGANAEVLKNLKISGSIEVDAVSVNNVKDFNTTAYDNAGTVQTRLQTHADWDLLDDVHARISLDKNNRTYGTLQPENVNGVETALTVDEAYTKIDKLFGYVDTTLGRQYYGEAGDVVIYYGPKYNLYGLPITAIDAGRFDWNGEKVGVTVLGGEITGNAIAAAPAITANTGNVSLWGIDVHAKPTDNITGSAYLYERTTIKSGTGALNVVGNDYLYVAGVKGKATFGGGWVKAEADKDFGSNRTVPGVGGSVYGTAANYTGWAGKVNAGYKADLGVGALTGWGEYALGSGGATTNRNFTAIAGDYRPGGIYGRFLAAGFGNLGNGLAEGSTLSNLQVIGVGVKANPSALSKLTVGLSWNDYRFQNIQGAQAIEAAIPGSAKGFSGSSQIGNEADLDLTWQHSENVSVSVGAGSFQPNGFIKDVNGATGVKGNNPATLMYADASIKF